MNLLLFVLTGLAPTPPTGIFVRAEWSAMQCDDRGKVVKAAYGNVPAHLTQSAAAVENGAFFLAIKLFEDGVHVVSDRLGVTVCWQHGMEWASQRHRACGGTFVAVCRYGVSTAPRRYQALDDIADGSSARDVLGNERADEFERKGAELHAPEKSDVATAAVHHKLVKRVDKTAASGI